MGLTENVFNYCFKVYEKKSFENKKVLFKIVPPIRTKDVRFKIVWLRRVKCLYARNVDISQIVNQ